MTDNPQQVNILTFNIRYDNKDDYPLNGWQVRHVAASQAITRSSPHLIGLQEVLPHQLEMLKQDLPLHYRFIGKGRGWDYGDEGGPIAVDTRRFDVIQDGQFWLSSTPNEPGSRAPGAGCPRICTWALLKDLASGGREIYFLNTHLDHVSSEARVHGAKQILDFVGSLRQDLYMILTGDFNCDQETSAEIKVIRQAMFVDSYRVLHPQIAAGNAEGTFHGFTGRPMSAKIDYIFLKGIGAKVLSAEIDKSKGSYGSYPSDHFPVTASVIFT